MVRSSGPRTASTMQNSEAPAALVSSAAGQYLVGVEEGRGLDRGVEPGRLRTEVAVLGAATRLGRQDALHLDLGPAPGQAHLVGQGGQRRHVGVGQGGQSGQLLAGQQAPLVEECRLGRVDAGPGRRGVDGRALGLTPTGRREGDGGGWRCLRTWLPR